MKLEELDLSGIRLLGNIYIDWKENRVKEYIYKQNTSNRNKSEQFRILKSNYYTIGRYSSEDDAYVEFKRTEHKADYDEIIKQDGRNILWAYPLFKTKLLILDKMGLYATGPVRVLTSMVFVYLFFSILFYILPHCVDTEIVSSLGEHGELTQLEKAFYHSAITFLTIGYGDFYPSGIIRWLSGIEGFIGLFMMSYFTVAFVRKILR